MKKQTILSVRAVPCLLKLKTKRPKLKAYLLITLLYFLMGQLKAQEIKPLNVGDKLPESFWQQEHTIYQNGKTTKQNLSAYKGKLMILDFWATWCSPCITSLETLNAVQQKMGDSLSVLALNEQPLNVWQPFVKAKGWRFNSFTQVDNLKKLFPHVTIPHQVWIYKEKVHFITSAHTATLANIRAVINDKQIYAYQKKDVDSFLIHKPLFVAGNGGTGQTIQFQSTLAKYTKDLPINRVYFKDGAFPQLSMLNVGVMRMHQWLYAKLKDPTLIYTNRSINLLPDSLKILVTAYNQPKDKIYQWIEKHTYSYNYMGNTKVDRSLLLKKISNELAAYFETIGVKVDVEYRDQPCYVIKAPLLWNALASKVEKPVLKPTKDGKVIFQNIPQKDVINYLQLQFQSSVFPLISDHLLDIPIDLTITDLRTVDALAISLTQAGLELKQETRKIPMLVFSYAKGGKSE